MSKFNQMIHTYPIDGSAPSENRTCLRILVIFLCKNFLFIIKKNLIILMYKMQIKMYLFFYSKHLFYNKIIVIFFRL